MITVYLSFRRSCGDGLVQLYQAPAVQQFLNGRKAKDTTEGAQKSIYQPGALRKVWLFESSLCDELAHYFPTNS